MRVTRSCCAPIIEHDSLREFAAWRRGWNVESATARATQSRCDNDVVVKDLRGNVDTRIRKLDEGQYDAVILASAGLVRLGLQDRISAAIEPSKCCRLSARARLRSRRAAITSSRSRQRRNWNHRETRSRVSQNVRFYAVSVVAASFRSRRTRLSRTTC